MMTINIPKNKKTIINQSSQINFCPKIVNSTEDTSTISTPQETPPTTTNNKIEEKEEQKGEYEDQKESINKADNKRKEQMSHNQKRKQIELPKYIFG